jgi:uncharacterized protein (TIGR02118 family)
MFKVLAFLTKREGIETQAFIDYYENTHVPLICSLAPTPMVYKRRYLVRGEALTKEGGAGDFDVVTELGFPDRAAFLAWRAQLSGPGAGEQVAADEEKFLDRSRTRAYVVEEHVTAG